MKCACYNLWYILSFICIGKRWRNHRCFYCTYYGPRHIKTQHKREQRVDLILKEKNISEAKRNITLLRLEGDHVYNMEQSEMNAVYRIIVRRVENPIYNHYSPCIYCFGWFKEYHLQRHIHDVKCLGMKEKSLNHQFYSKANCWKKRPLSSYPHTLYKWLNNYDGAQLRMLL